MDAPLGAEQGGQKRSRRGEGAVPALWCCSERTWNQRRRENMEKKRTTYRFRRNPPNWRYIFETQFKGLTCSEDVT
ncbi:hypothetical protein BRADI_2g31380v3 [Brachypodium distachyon]|uniref:Uncharacterized protein n=1 Tax=Brachypodium distachyon TaxID=15368 RepID=A0A0Q3G6C9_BRADI|nr:hypothetical protein BRADI_2g31380v3 [Brachypodium distachyon]PNT71556.1 hypothetical protein BRADI_2g31380v3 [Brachypodium distachyon]PNT71557.1 hypothetical protein BRADI_2g31380v3 [Brachypodium distachyon]